MAGISIPTSAQFVVKITKFCNLRCTYCYEYSELSIKQRMQLSDLRRLFMNIAAQASENSFSSISFIWHGGEPFPIPIHYYHEIQAMQEEILNHKVRYSNAVQTNLTVLTERHMELIGQDRFFKSLGVSFDVLGNQRVDKHARLRTGVITTNMQKLLQANVSFGAIVVLARNTLPFVERIYRYYDSLGITMRFLPFYRQAYDWQSSQHALSFDELTVAFKTLLDTWLTSERATPVEPIGEYLDYAIAYLTDASKHFYDRLKAERVFIVNIDGGVWGIGEAYDSDACYGNLFKHDLGSMLASPNRNRVSVASSERMAKYCGNCPYFGYCPGFFVGNATREQQKVLAEDGCPVRIVIGHIIERLRVGGLQTRLSAAVGQRRFNEALQVTL